MPKEEKHRSRHEGADDSKVEKGHRFSLSEDREAKAIAKSEHKQHPNYSKERDYHIGYGRVANLRKKRK